MISFINKITALLLITRPHIILPILFTPAAVAFLVNQGIPPLDKTILGMLVAVTAIAGAHTFNDFCDKDIDPLNPRTKNRPLSTKIITSKAALIYSILLLVISIIFAYKINFICLALILFGIILIISYSLKLKRTKIGFILPALGAVLLPFGAWATYKPESIFSLTPMLVAILGFFIEIPPYFCHTILDIKGDRNRKAYTLPVSWGIKFTSKLMFFMYFVSLLIIIYLWKVADLGTPYLLVTPILGLIILRYYINFMRFPAIIEVPKLFNLTMGYIVIWSLMVILGVLANCP